MITIRSGRERGRTTLSWLDSRHSFSFGHYDDPEHRGFGALRVINEDRVVPGGGFETHGHRDMEIVSYVLEGALEHKDSLGTGSVIRPGEVQRMSAGSGIRHSEFNPSTREPVHFLQVWIEPEVKDLEPSYEQKTFAESERRGRLRLIASRNGREESVTLRQDVDLYAGLLDPGQSLVQALAEGRRAWAQVAHGSLELNGQRLNAGDGAAITAEKCLEIEAKEAAEILLFDMA